VTMLRTVGLAMGWGVALLWAARTVEWMRGVSRLPDLLTMPPGVPHGRLSVVVPARNEEENVDAGLRSLLASKDVDLEVIAVDDRSEDRTGSIMQALQEEQRASGVRYAVEHVRELPKGWLGKPHAMAGGAELATGEWLLFTDADVVFAEDALARALTYMEREGGDHLLVVPTVVARSGGERMMLPFLHVLSIWGPRMWRVADPKSRDAVGVGAFNMMRRTTYENVGGWERLRMEVIEDLSMGVVIKRAGFRSRVVTGRDLVRIRWASGALGVVTNLTKNVFAAFRFRIGLIVAGTAVLALMCLLPFGGIVWGLIRDQAWLWPSLVSLAALAALYWRYQHFADTDGANTMLWLPAFPVAALVFVYAMARSTAQTLIRGGVEWRGTFYSLRELREHLGPLR
jgi:GT2 family glycosyltransferase